MKASPITIKLEEPIHWGKEEVIEEITLQVPKAKHVKDMNLKDINVSDILKLTSKLSQVSITALDELGMADLMAITEAVGNLLEGGRKIGDNA